MEIKQFTDDALKHVFEICTSTMNILELLGYEPYKIRGQKCKEILNIYANQIGVNIDQSQRKGEYVKSLYSKVIDTIPYNYYLRNIN